MPPSRSPHAPRPSGRALRSALAALLVLTAGGLAACGGGGGSSASTTTSTNASTTTTTAGGAALAKFTACLKQHGVTLPARGPGGFGGGNAGPPTGTTGADGATGPTARRGGGFGGAKFQAAQTACAKLLPANSRGGGFFGRGGAGGGNNAAFAAYRNCLTLHGVKIGAGFGRGGPQGATGVPKQTAKVRKALAACAGLRPAFGVRPPSSTTPTTTSS
jgi:hypothetical protein